MNQNLVSLSFTPADISAMTAAINTLKEKLAGLVELSVDQRSRLTKMGVKSEAFCRETLIVLDQNRNNLLPEYDLDEARNDLATLDLLRPIFASLRELAGQADDTEMALGSDILTAALDGYAQVRLSGRGIGLDRLREAMSERLSRRPKAAPPA